MRLLFLLTGCRRFYNPAYWNFQYCTAYLFMANASEQSDGVIEDDDELLSALQLPMGYVNRVAVS